MAKCLRKTWPRNNHFSRMLRAQQRVKHWPNLRHDDAACGAWGTWRIPMGGMASSKARVTCAKCRRLCGLDDGVDKRKLVERKVSATLQRQRRKARERRRAQKIAEKLVSAWERCHEWYALDSTAQARSMLVSLIAGVVLKERR